MLRLTGSGSPLARGAAVMTTVIVLTGCGSATKRADAEGPPKSCQATVLDTLGRVLARVYREGIFSERTASAHHMIEASLPLRRALEIDSPTAARAAAQELIATGHMTNLRIMRGTHKLVELGGPALTPFSGTIKDAQGNTLGSYLTSVWSDAGFIAEGNGVAEGLVALRAGSTQIGGALALPPGPLGSEGTVTIKDVPYQYTSFPGAAYPSGVISVFLLRPVSSTSALCGSSSLETTANTLGRIANLIYTAEGGRRTLAQVRRVQRDQPLLQAVARARPDRRAHGRRSAAASPSRAPARARPTEPAAGGRRRPVRACPGHRRLCVCGGQKIGSSCSRSRTTRATSACSGGSWG